MIELAYADFESLGEFVIRGHTSQTVFQFLAFLFDFARFLSQQPRGPIKLAQLVHNGAADAGHGVSFKLVSLAYVVFFNRVKKPQDPIADQISELDVGRETDRDASGDIFDKIEISLHNRISQKVASCPFIVFPHLVKYVAGRIAIGLPPNIEFGDLVSYGILGLFDAIEKYDVSQGNKFETYGVSRIRGAIMDELRKLDWAPRLLRKRAREIERKMRELEDRNGRAATEEELAKSLKMTVEDLNGIYNELNSTTFLSLDEVWQNDDGNKPISRLQTVEDSLVTNQFSFVHQGEVKELLAQALDQLPEKEKLVVVLYYYENLTLREIGEVL